MSKVISFWVLCSLLLFVIAGCGESVETEADVETELDELAAGLGFDLNYDTDSGPDLSIVQQGEKLVQINSPVHEERFGPNDEILLNGEAYIGNDQIDESEMEWYSDLDGFLGSGPELSAHDLSVGMHEISLHAGGLKSYITISKLTKDWTIMLYMSGDNNLEANGIEDINEMEMVGSDSNVNIIAVFDRTPGYDYSNGNWTDTRYFYITSDGNASTINSTLLGNAGEREMDRASSLALWTWYGVTNYPAAKYALIIWDHGSGWEKDGDDDPVKGSCSDDTSGWGELEIWEVRWALMAAFNHLSINKIDLLGYDACLMGMAEVAMQTTDIVDTFVGSEENEGLDGWEYDRWLSALTSNPSASSTTLGSYIVDAYYGSWGYDTLSAQNTGNDSNFISALNAFADAMTAALPTYKTQISNARLYTKKFNGSNFIDLYDFTIRIKNQSLPGSVLTAATNLQSAMSSYIIAYNGSAANSYGASVWFPGSMNATSMNTYQSLTQWAALTTWDEFLNNYF